ncbi:MAG TPA: o-succinylbenzoate synthase [Acidimicrobiales bacterium]|nr:o-succinylbenzoate synthase [Acidimicrobiales bacterium]
MEVVLAAVELRVIRMPLAEPFVTARGTRRGREVVLVRALVADGPDGWGECVAEPEPTYWPEYTAGAYDVLQHHLVPRLLDGRSLRQVRGHHMAKAALECAALDAGLRAEGRSMASFLGATRPVVPTGIAIGRTRTIDGLVDAVLRWHGQGHRAFKIKIEPGWDVEPLEAVRGTVGEEVALLADANGSYRSDSVEEMATLCRLADASIGLVALEQPFAPDDLVGHARLGRQIDVPVCLDESIGSLADLESALTLEACGAVSLKAGRVGGLVETRRIHARCRDAGVSLRCGGMLETGLGRALNLAVAALPGCNLPPDLGPSARYFTRDITPPFESNGGTMIVPDGPGLGVEPRLDILDEVTVTHRTIWADE